MSLDAIVSFTSSLQKLHKNLQRLSGHGFVISLCHELLPNYQWINEKERRIYITTANRGGSYSLVRINIMIRLVTLSFPWASYNIYDKSVNVKLVIRQPLKLEAENKAEGSQYGIQSLRQQLLSALRINYGHWRWKSMVYHAEEWGCSGNCF